MATPGYPQMGQMPPMGGPMAPNPMMGGGPTTGMRPVRRGTSKAVPVVVSAGLAVGVFCGLLFGVGTGKKDAQAASPSASNVKKEAEARPEPNAAPAGLGATSAKPATPTTPTTPPAGSGAVATAGSAATPAPPTTPTTPAKPEEKKIKLTVKVKPEAAQKDAKVSIDDKDIEGMVADIPTDKKTVKIEVKATGYRSYEKKLDLVGDSDMTLEIELSKRPSGGNTGGVHPPKRPDRPPSSGGGLIDI